MRSTPHPTNSRQSRLREKAEEINLVLLEPDVDLWKLRELAISDGGLVNGAWNHEHCRLLPFFQLNSPSFDQLQTLFAAELGPSL